MTWNVFAPKTTKRGNPVYQRVLSVKSNSIIKALEKAKKKTKLRDIIVSEKKRVVLRDAFTGIQNPFSSPEFVPYFNNNLSPRILRYKFLP